MYFRQRLNKQKRKLAEQRIIQLEQEKQLEITQAILDGETTERSRLARDLHDGLGGMLSVLKLGLYDIKLGMSSEKENGQPLEKSILLLDESIRELRRVAHNMMPESLVRDGLKISLTDFCNSIPHAEFHYFGQEKRLEQNLEILIYRIVYELINNSLKYAEATSIHAQIVQEADRISLTIHDNGKGFEPSAVRHGIGLANIRDRVVSYNGQMTLWSEIGKGTEVNVEFNLSKTT
jgi:signal transduction histidine kinase